MIELTRRRWLRNSVVGGSGLFLGPKMAQIVAMAQGSQSLSVEAWMDQWMKARAPEGTLNVSRFAEPMYFLLKPITWRPNPGQEKYKAVTVPVGFVTDFASIPRPFWSLLRPDGDYTYPAIVHDYLYWTQQRPRDTSDEILKFGMQDFGVKPSVVEVIYRAVRVGGGAAWTDNAKLKASGEKRVLKCFPDDPRVRWSDWKKVSGVFEKECDCSGQAVTESCKKN